MEELLNFIAQTIYDKKGFNILVLDIREISTMTDYFVIAEGSVDKHVQSIAESVEEKLKEKGIDLFQSEGKKSGQWVVLDFGGLMVHLFSEGMREKYSLETLWQEGTIVNVKIDVLSRGKS